MGHEVNFYVAINEGDIYHKLGEKMKAVKAYSSAMSVYKEGQWVKEIEIGRQQDSLIVGDIFVPLDAWKAGLCSPAFMRRNSHYWIERLKPPSLRWMSRSGT